MTKKGQIPGWQVSVRRRSTSSDVLTAKRWGSSATTIWVEQIPQPPKAASSTTERRGAKRRDVQCVEVRAFGAAGSVRLTPRRYLTWLAGRGLYVRSKWSPTPNLTNTNILVRDSLNLIWDRRRDCSCTRLPGSFLLLFIVSLSHTRFFSFFSGLSLIRDWMIHDWFFTKWALPKCHLPKTQSFFKSGVWPRRQLEATLCNCPSEVICRHTVIGPSKAVTQRRKVKNHPKKTKILKSIQKCRFFKRAW